MSGHRRGLIIQFRGEEPRIAEGVFIAPGAVVIGRAKLAEGSSVWFNSVIRADIAPIEIGEETNIQDMSVLHVADEHPCIVGKRVVVGHRAILHGCRVGDETLIGMGATILNSAVIGEHCVIAAGSLVTEGAVIPAGCVVMGTPGKVVRPTTPAQVESTIHFAKKYARLAQEYLKSLGSS